MHPYLFFNNYIKEKKSLWEANLVGSLCFDNCSTEMISYLKEDKIKCLHLFRFDIGKTNTSSTDLMAGAEVFAS